MHPEDADIYDEGYQNNGQLQEVFHIIDQAVFTSLEHEIVGHLSEYGIQEMNGFSVSFNFILYKDEENQNRNMNSDIFQTGTTAKKNLQIQLTPQLNLKIVYRIGKEKDYLFSQQSIKYNKNYYFCLTIEKSKDEQGKDIYNLAMYINGVIQGIVSITIPIDLPSEQIFIGGSAVPIFKGEISDLVIVTRSLSMDEIQYISEQKNQTEREQQQHQGRTIYILDEYQAIHHQTPEQKARIVLNPQQRHSLPLSLTKSHISFYQEKQQQEQNQISEEEQQQKKLDQGIFNLEELLFANSALKTKCRELAFSFKWVFTTLQQLSPQLLAKSDIALNFQCLSRGISTDQVKSDEYYPLYIIELERFMKVIQYANLPLNKDEIILLAETCGWIKTYKQEEENLTILGIIYDKFMISIRNACMSSQEVREIKGDCLHDPHHMEPQEGETFTFDSFTELLDTCKEMEMTEDEARKYTYIGLSVRGVPFKGGKSKFCCNRDPRMQFYETILQRYPDFYTNPDTCAQIYEEIGQGQEINLATFSVYCTQFLQLFAQEEMEADDLNETMKKIFLNFAFTNENVIYYKEFETVLKTLYPTVLYSNGINTIEVFPRSVKQKKILWGYQDQPYMHEKNKQLGGLRFVNKENYHFLSAEIKYVTPFYVEYSQRKENKQWSVIGQTQQNLGNWSSDKLELGGDYQYQFYNKQKLKFQFMAIDDQDVKLAQQIKCNLSQIIGKQNKNYKLDFGAKDVKGNLNLQWEIESSGDNFVDYLLGGLNLNLSLAIDWTVSNGDKYREESLHYLGKKGVKPLNNYQSIIQYLGQVFMPYEEDELFPLWGFGADPNYVKYGFPDCFSMNGSDNPHCKGVQEMLDAYEFTNQQVEMGTRTVFQPALQKMIEKVVKNPPKQSTYSFVVILADTENYDNQEVMDLLVEASEHPISFLVVGMGKESFKDLYYLNENDQVTNSQGKKIIRQCTQFIRYDDVSSKEAFAQIVLEKFQQQVKIYYKMHKVLPPNIADLKNGKTVMHFLHPERFEPKKEEDKDKKDAKKQATKKGKKGKTPEEEAKDNIFTPKYEVVECGLKETPAQMRLFMTIQQIPEHSYGGTYHRLFRNLNVDVDEQGGPVENFQSKYVPVERVQNIPQVYQDDQIEQVPSERFQPPKGRHHHDKSASQSRVFESKQLLAMIKFKPSDYNYKKDFLRTNEKINGFKFQYSIVSKLISQLFKDNNQVIDRCNLVDIEPIYENGCRGYEWPLTLDEKEVLPTPCEQWNQGKLQIVVQRCVKCHEHQGTSWHDEADFADRFNAFGELFKSYFANIEILSNYDKPTTLECFDAYIRGVGPVAERDSQGRIYLFRKQEKLSSFMKNFDRRMLQPFDKLVLLSAGYSDSVEMEKAQDRYFKTNCIPKKWAFCQEFPCEIPERLKDIQAAKDKAEQIPSGTKMICRNWGCDQPNYLYSEDDMATKYACLHHPGTYQMGSIHGLWPESWTCCRESWSNAGCTKGKHRGVSEKKLTHLCLSRGEVNPKTGQPDSACGRVFSEDGQIGETCVYHRGYFRWTNKKGDEGQWTCCHDNIRTLAGCFSDNHKFASWPDEEAKLYFVEKPQFNSNWREDKIEPYSKTAIKSCVYRETVPYKPYVSTKTQMYHDRLANEYEIRICLNNGCDTKNMKFREVDNKTAKDNRKFTCTKHPGVFDFGHSGGVKSVSEALGDENAIWKPHWSCCRGAWNSAGCTKTYHYGPVEQGMEPLKYGRWPSHQAMKYFHKTGSDLWKKKFEELMIGQDDAKLLWNKFSKGKVFSQPQPQPQPQPQIERNSDKSIAQYL